MPSPSVRLRDTALHLHHNTTQHITSQHNTSYYMQLSNTHLGTPHSPTKEGRHGKHRRADTAHHHLTDHPTGRPHPHTAEQHKRGRCQPTRMLLECTLHRAWLLSTDRAHHWQAAIGPSSFRSGGTLRGRQTLPAPNRSSPPFSTQCSSHTGIFCWQLGHIWSSTAARLVPRFILRNGPVRGWEGLFRTCCSMCSKCCDFDG